MTPDTRAQLGENGWNTSALRELSLHCLDLGSVARIVEPNLLDTPYDRLVDEGPHAVSGGPHGSRPFEHVHDTVLDREDGLDLQDAGCDARCLADAPALNEVLHGANEKVEMRAWLHPCLLYTSDAADDLLCVDLGGRRIIKKKKIKKKNNTNNNK